MLLLDDDDDDGVLVAGTHLIPGADGFLQRLKALGSKYLVLTNNPMYTPGDLSHRLGPIEPVLARIDPLLATPIHLSAADFAALGHLHHAARLHRAARACLARVRWSTA